MTTNRTAVVALLAIGVLGFSSCDRNERDATNTESTTGTTVSNTTTSTGAGTDMDADRTTRTGTAVDSTSGGAGLAAETPDDKDARETTVGAKKVTGKDGAKNKKNKNKTGAGIPPRGDRSDDYAAVDSSDSVNHDASSSSGTASSGTSTDDEMVNPNKDPMSDTSSDSQAAKSGSADQAVIGARMGDKMNRNLAMQRQEQMSKAYEPQSKSPDKTGATSMTGMDRSHAQMSERSGVFVDPTVGGQPMASSQPIENVDLNRFSYDKRGEFKELMSTRLDQIENRLGSIKNSDKEVPSNQKNVIENIEMKHERTEDLLTRIDKIDRKGWSEYKEGFRNRVSELERSVDTLQTSMNR